MPPKAKQKLMRPRKFELVLLCEYEGCNQEFRVMEEFTSHVTQHLGTVTLSNRPFAVQTFSCPWHLCGATVHGLVTDFIRHVYFHSFHVKIKCVGQQVIDNDQLTGCLLDNSGRNLIPELPERLQCGWEHCEVVLDIPEVFYRHVDSHSDSYPDGNNVLGGCRCHWEGCDAICKSKYKLKEHLRSHTQEKIVACPACGGLFSNRTKFLDHLKRQADADEQCYQCSHCNKRFSTERLLRDHVRHHVNQYKCPCCDMTCATPSSLKSHLRYRHTNEKPFQCEHCSFGAKTVNDLRRHLESHNTDTPYRCHVAECDYVCRTYLSLTNHFKREHNENSVQKYMCHVCQAVFTRGSKLTIHLKKKHKFRWPSGHSRFRYKQGEDGFLRLQTVRYESIQLTEQPQIESASHVDVSAAEPPVNVEGTVQPTTQYEPTTQKQITNAVSSQDLGGVSNHDSLDVNTNQNASQINSGSDLLTINHSDLGGMQHEGSNSSHESTTLYQINKDYSDRGVTGAGPGSSTDGTGTELSINAKSSNEKKARSQQNSAQGHPVDSEVMSSQNISSVSPKRRSKSRSSLPPSASSSVKDPIPVMLVDTGCIINIPNYESSPSKEAAGPQKVNIMCNNNSENLTYNLEMLGDVALLVPSEEKKATAGKKRTRSKSKESSDKEDKSKSCKMELAYIGDEGNIGSNEKVAKRMRKSDSHKEIVKEYDWKSSGVAANETDHVTEESDLSTTCSSESEITNVETSLSPEGLNCKVKKRARKSFVQQILSPSMNNMMELSSLGTPMNKSVKEVSKKANGNSKVKPRVKAVLSTQHQKEKKEENSSMNNQTGMKIEKILRDRSPIKSAHSEDIFTLFPGPRTRRKEQEKC